jgi:hypothetical protein
MGVIAGKGLADVAVSFEIVCRTYVGYGALHTIMIDLLPPKHSLSNCTP